MVKNFILASGNTHKASEFSDLFDVNLLQVVAAPEKIEVEENGESFQENAFLKADAYFKKFKQPTLADDSGLVIKSLPGELGIHSARFGGVGLDDKDRAALLLERMSAIESGERGAYFICVLCFILSEDEVFFFEGRLDGDIGYKFQGEMGFGYDPVFLPKGLKGKSLAEDASWKQVHSHRAVASQFAEEFFKERICQLR